MTTRRDADISEEEIDEPTDLQRDGMADMMSRILSQKIDGKVPVLAKRKTAMMKALEEDAEILKNSKKLKASRPALPVNVELQLLDKETSIDFERQLKKLATKGVVALFNAISKSKRGAMGGVGDAKEGVDASKNQNANDDDDDSWHDAEKTTAKSKISPDTRNKNLVSHFKKSSRSNSSKPNDSAVSDNMSTKKWSVFEEDSIGQRKLTLKNWDQENNSDDERP